ncbi:helix-turn-helix transcriptional regulator [Streptosporangium sp. NPDC020145]|uniref:helix-turn-helix domain-containing protein n=1 Tax=Streptosporangium sp. NPDC020145 TaxID=3154694 RepID=UPI00341F71A6
MPKTIVVPKFNGEKLRQARIRAGISLRDSRWKFKSPGTRLVQWQRGAHVPKIETAQYLAQVLGCPVSDFYDYVEVGGDDE